MPNVFLYLVHLTFPVNTGLVIQKLLLIIITNDGTFNKEKNGFFLQLLQLLNETANSKQIIQMFEFTKPGCRSVFDFHLRIRRACQDNVNVCKKKW